MTPEKKNKKTSAITDDLKINRGINVKVKAINVNEPKVIEINLSLFAIPQETQDVEEYEYSINKIRKKYNKICSDYVRDNSYLMKNKFITDFNFTSANLKSGYNKYVTMSLYVKQNGNLNFKQIKNKVRESFKDSAKSISDTIRNEKFSCYKSKQTKKAS